MQLSGIDIGGQKLQVQVGEGSLRASACLCDPVIMGS